MKKLIENGIKPDIIYGTSTGALQAAGYAHLGMASLEQMWLSIKDKSDVFGLNWWPHILTLGLTLDGKYHMKPLEAKLNAITQSSTQKLCEAVVTRVCLETGAIEYVKYDDPEFTMSVLASASVPFVSRPIKINGKNYVDGGVRDQIPVMDIERLIGEGYKVIVVSTNPTRINPTDSWKKPSFIPLWAIIQRVAEDILPTESWLDELRQIKKMKESGADIEIYMPDQLWMKTEEYDPSKIRQGIDMGYAAEPKDLINLDL